MTALVKIELSESEGIELFNTSEFEEIDLLNTMVNGICSSHFARKLATETMLLNASD